MVRPFIGTIGVAFRRRSGASEGTGARVIMARTTGFATTQPDFAIVVAVACPRGASWASRGVARPPLSTRQLPWPFRPAVRSHVALCGTR